MKIKKEFWELIKNGIKTIELRKVNKLGHYIDRETAVIETLGLSTGRFNIPLYDENNNEKLGTITINGYEIIKNPFTDEMEQEFSKRDIAYQNFGSKNMDWIINNYQWLYEYFKDETEILVLKIESWSE